MVAEEIVVAEKLLAVVCIGSIRLRWTTWTRIEAQAWHRVSHQEFNL